MLSGLSKYWNGHSVAQQQPRNPLADLGRGPMSRPISQDVARATSSEPQSATPCRAFHPLSSASAMAFSGALVRIRSMNWFTIALQELTRVLPDAYGLE